MRKTKNHRIMVVFMCKLINKRTLISRQFHMYIYFVMALYLKNKDQNTSKKGVQNLYCQLFCENVPLRQSSDVLNELLLYDVG